MKKQKTKIEVENLYRIVVMLVLVMTVTGFFVGYIVGNFIMLKQLENILQLASIQPASYINYNNVKTGNETFLLHDSTNYPR